MGAEICCTQFRTLVLMAMLHAKDQELFLICCPQVV